MSKIIPFIFKVMGSLTRFTKFRISITQAKLFNKSASSFSPFLVNPTWRSHARSRFPKKRSREVIHKYRGQAFAHSKHSKRVNALLCPQIKKKPIRRFTRAALVNLTCQPTRKWLYACVDRSVFLVNTCKTIVKNSERFY